MTLPEKKTVELLAACAAFGLCLVTGGLSCEQHDRLTSVTAADNNDARPAERAQTADDPESAARLNRLLQKRDAEIDALLKRMEKLESEIQSLRRSREAGDASAAGTFETAPSSTIPPHPPETAPLQYPQSGQHADEEAAQTALDRLLVKRSGLLLPPWTSEIEAGITYVHASSDRISVEGLSAEFEDVGVRLIIGDIAAERVRRDIVIPAVTYRLGLPADMQADVHVPFRYEAERTVTTDVDEHTRKAVGLGDIELALSRQLTREHGWLPDLLGHLRWKTKTGSDPFGADTNDPPLGAGFHSLQFSATAVKAQDPVAFFGGLSYTLNVSDTKPPGRIAPNDPSLSPETPHFRVDPGDIWGVNLGMALALNLETSLNFGWEQRFAGRTRIQDTPVPGSALRVGIFRVGITHALTRDVALDVAVGIGLTQDAPDVQATVAVPVRLPGLFSGEAKPAAAKPASP